MVEEEAAIAVEEVVIVVQEDPIKIAEACEPQQLPKKSITVRVWCGTVPIAARVYGCERFLLT